MSAMTKYNRHLSRMDRALYEARNSFLGAGTLEADHLVIKRLTKDLTDEIAALVETITDENCGDLGEVALDEIGAAFMGAIDKRDDRRSPESRAAYVAEMERERA